MWLRLVCPKDYTDEAGDNFGNRNVDGSTPRYVFDTRVSGTVTVGRLFQSIYNRGDGDVWNHYDSALANLHSCHGHYSAVDEGGCSNPLLQEGAIAHSDGYRGSDRRPFGFLGTGACDSFKLKGA